MTGKGISNTAMASVEKARKAGFFISAIDSPITELVKRVRESGKGREIFDQFANGKDSNKFCISYRGKFYQDEVKRFAQAMAKVKPDFVSMDIEQWGAGPVHSRKCLRCQADFKASGLSSWEEWQEVKGEEIIEDLVSSAQKAVKAAGGKPLIIGSYNVSPEHVYQGGVFNFDRLYPESLNTGEGTTYSSLQPADIIFIGDKARGARAKMTQSNVMPWLTPGDAGPYPGVAFQWSLLENYANGSRGVWFWSNRVWDSENLIAYNKVIRAIASVEDIIVKGDLVGSAATVEGKGRISGMKQGSRMVLLAADYLEESDGILKLHLDLPAKSQLRDLFSGQTVGEPLAAGTQTINLPLNGQQARLLEVAPVDGMNQ